VVTGQDTFFEPGSDRRLLGPGIRDRKQDGHQAT
jgi:hypothetical protein